MTDDGASLVWTGGEYIYALRGEYQETVPNQDFSRFHIPTNTWDDMSSIPETEGVGDGASLLWVDEYPDNIFAFGGGSCLEKPGYNFYSYSLSQNQWSELGSIPCSVGKYNGNRLGFIDKHIYYWQGVPSTWDCNGNGFYKFEFITTDITPPSPITNFHPTPGTTWLNFTWLNPPDPDFNYTELYLNGTFLTNIPAPQNYYNITGLLPDTSYELSTRTVDTSGNINGTWVNDTASTLPASGMTLDLYTGWNLISLPLVPEDTSITSLLSSINSNYSIIWEYNASDTSDHWKKYDPSAPFGNDLTNMEPGKGYWILMIFDNTPLISGTVPGSTDTNLTTGWNLIGYNSLDSQPISEALSSISGNYTIIWAYDASDTADHWIKYDPLASFGNDLEIMEPAKGYWIMMSANDYLRYSFSPKYEVMWKPSN